VASTISGVLAIIGAALVLLAGVGVVRFPDLYSRMHAATKATTLGIALVAVAGAIALDDGASKLLLATVLTFVTAPVASHLVGRSGYRAEHIEIRLEAGDDLATMMERDGADD
jgi:multicomponent Na+:H+ antiporter subunit G